MLHNCDFKVVTQPYSASFLEEHIIKSNMAIIRCHLPAFVADFVSVESWVFGKERIKPEDGLG